MRVSCLNSDRPLNARGTSVQIQISQQIFPDLEFHLDRVLV
jgi:hypothetical protein